MAVPPIEFPQPDPLLRLIPDDEAPNGFWRLPPNTRSERARVYIMARLAGEAPVVAWLFAMDLSPPGEEYARSIVENPPGHVHTDEEYEAAIRNTMPGGRL